ncbi:hypothetical protein M3697_16590 [Janibacter melonis]|uniref:hypothetical protein n=1 Tax=Janibacter melonis TaxID=262209 RepID=UPI0020444BBF|nr:hypothetical protein [Janibacter melonis]MCM3556706.1 hypothetical protein [Janibacter melonis]
MTIEPARTAWGDESIRDLDGAGRGRYLLGAAIPEPQDCAYIRAQLLSLPRSEQKLHWHSADERRRRAIVKVVDLLPSQHVVVVAIPVDRNRQDRARAKCLERMLYELDLRGVAELVMEARTDALNRKDLKLVDQLRGSRRLTSPIRLNFGEPSGEPLLWLPDQVLGAVGAADSGDDRWLTQTLRQRVERVDIEIE